MPARSGAGQGRGGEEERSAPISPPLRSPPAGSHIPGGPLSVALEPILMKWGVDLVLQGHSESQRGEGARPLTPPTPPSLLAVHCYERSAAQFNGTVLQRSDAFGAYHDPGAPVYITQGTSGAVLDFTKNWISPQPAWSEARSELHYGFGRMGLSATASAFTLAYDFVDKDGTVQDHFSIVKTRKAAAH